MQNSELYFYCWISKPMLCQDLLDRLSQCLMVSCKTETWSLVARVHMLELIEMRSMSWRLNEHVTRYYQQKLAQIEENKNKMSPPSPAVTLSEDVITNKNESHTSDVRSYSLGLKVRDEELVVTGSNLEMVKTAKIVLHEFFNVCSTVEATKTDDHEMKRRINVNNNEKLDDDDETNIDIEMTKPEISYNKEQLLAMSKSPFCQELPETLTFIARELPGVVRKSDSRAQGPTSRLLMREMEGLRRQEEAAKIV